MELSQPNSILRPSPRRPFEQPTEHVAPTFDLSAVSDSESDDNDHVSSSRHGGTGAGAVLGTLCAENSPSLDSDAFSQSTGLDDAGRTRSILNLTSSTLRGIYTEAELDGPTEPGTPNGGGATGAHTPSIFKSSQLGLSAVAKQLDPAGERAGGSDDLDPATEMLSPISNVPEATPPEHLAQHRRRQSTAERMASMTGRATLLFGFGVAYGLVVTHLHKTTSDGRAAAVMPVPLDTADALGKRSPWFLAFWGIMGIILGSLLPWFDRVWADLVSASVSLDQEVEAKDDKEGKIVVRGRRRRRVMGVHTDWTAVVRSIGAFVGIAFAIVSTSCQRCYRKTMADTLFTASVTLAVHFASIPGAVARQSCPLVCY